MHSIEFYSAREFRGENYFRRKERRQSDTYTLEIASWQTLEKNARDLERIRGIYQRDMLRQTMRVR